MDPKFTAALPHPFYGDHVLYHAYNHWGSRPGRAGVGVQRVANREHVVENGLLHPCRLVEQGPVSIKGPEAKKYLQSLLINSLANFPIGSMKHGVMCTEDGLIAAHGIIERKADDHFEFFAGGPP